MRALILKFIILPWGTYILNLVLYPPGNYFKFSFFFYNFTMLTSENKSNNHVVFFKNKLFKIKVV